jgi:hypothetical protein
MPKISMVQPITVTLRMASARPAELQDQPREITGTVAMSKEEDAGAHPKLSVLKKVSILSFFRRRCIGTEWISTRSTANTRRDLRREEGRGAGRPLQPVRRALLPDPLPAAQQHPRLAEADRRGAAAEAYEVSQATNTFPEICGRICPQDRLCEGNCVIEQSGHGTVTIGSVEKYITDTAWEEAGSADPPAASAPRASASSARARRAGRGRHAAPRGLQVTVYDRYDRAGGLMTYGIPGFKLEKDVVMRRNAQLRRAASVPAELRRRRGHHLRGDPRGA